MCAAIQKTASPSPASLSSSSSSSEAKKIQEAADMARSEDAGDTFSKDPDAKFNLELLQQAPNYFRKWTISRDIAKSMIKVTQKPKSKELKFIMWTRPDLKADWKKVPAGIGKGLRVLLPPGSVPHDSFPKVRHFGNFFADYDGAGVKNKSRVDGLKSAKDSYELCTRAHPKTARFHRGMDGEFYDAAEWLYTFSMIVFDVFKDCVTQIREVVRDKNDAPLTDPLARRLAENAAYQDNEKFKGLVKLNFYSDGTPDYSTAVVTVLHKCFGHLATKQPDGLSDWEKSIIAGAEKQQPVPLYFQPLILKDETGEALPYGDSDIRPNCVVVQEILIEAPAINKGGGKDWPKIPFWGVGYPRIISQGAWTNLAEVAGGGADGGGEVDNIPPLKGDPYEPVFTNMEATKEATCKGLAEVVASDLEKAVTSSSVAKEKARSALRDRTNKAMAAIKGPQHDREGGGGGGGQAPRVNGSLGTPFFSSSSSSSSSSFSSPERTAHVSKEPEKDGNKEKEKKKKTQKTASAADASTSQQPSSLSSSASASASLPVAATASEETSTAITKTKKTNPRQEPKQGALSSSSSSSSSSATEGASSAQHIAQKRKKHLVEDSSN